ncbi:MAG: hypothetical protein DDT26_00792 [Dehalococcoidia bacterium]|nr:hypothetical protein [Chloroflexota bacterium]
MMESFVEVKLASPDDFLKVKETLTRIGIASERKKCLYQSAHILHKRGRYWIMHFKEMFILDGRPSSMTAEDIERRNLIANLLHDWGLVELVDYDTTDKNEADISSIRIIPHKEKAEWTLVPKYNMGVKK